MKKKLLTILIITMIIFIRICFYKRSKEYSVPPKSINLTKETKHEQLTLDDEKINCETKTEKDDKIDTSDNIYNPTTWAKHSNVIKDKLKNLQIKSIENMCTYLKNQQKMIDFSGSVYKLCLSDGTLAVFKTDECGSLGKEAFEEVAFDISVNLGFPYVPPTVFRTLTCDFNGDGNICTKSGFISLFIDTDIDLVKLNRSEFNDILAKINEDDLENFKIFNFIFGKWDVGPHNMLISNIENTDVGDNYYPISIDNESISNSQHVKYRDIPFVKMFKLASQQHESETFPFNKSEYCNAKEKEKIKNQYNIYAPGRKHNYIIFNNAYWAQFIDSYWGSETDITDLIYPSYIPKITKKKLQKLTEEDLLKLYGYSSQYVSTIVQDVLKRRDMLFEHFE